MKASSTVKDFVAYITGHDRPIHELLDPKQKDMHQIHDREFVWMTSNVVGYAELADARRQCVETPRRELSSKERGFSISIKQPNPD